MTGKKGSSGGSRPGAGRPPSTFRLSDGHKVLLYYAGTGGHMATIRVISKKMVVLEQDNGSRIVITR